MSTKQKLIITFLWLAVLGLGFSHWRLRRELTHVHTPVLAGHSSNEDAERAAEKLRQAETRLHEAQTQLQIAEQKLTAASERLAALENRAARPGFELTTRRLGPRSSAVPANALVFEPVADIQQPGVKRGWGPEQVVGEPDTMQAGDVSTAWAPREQDGGAEWLKLDYESAVDIAEVRVRETYNPGAISKVTAFTADGREVTIWEGVEPKSEAPVEMAFAVPNSINAKSVKVYLDTQRVPGWNEIDAVQLIGKDGSQQWAKQASASSTYAEPRAARETLGLDRF